MKDMLKAVQPQFFIPVHGETRHLHLHARLAQRPVCVRPYLYPGQRRGLGHRRQEGLARRAGGRRRRAGGWPVGGRGGRHRHAGPPAPVAGRLYRRADPGELAATSWRANRRSSAAALWPATGRATCCKRRLREIKPQYQRGKGRCARRHPRHAPELLLPRDPVAAGGAAQLYPGVSNTQSNNRIKRSQASLAPFLIPGRPAPNCPARLGVCPHDTGGTSRIEWSQSIPF